MKNFQKNWSPCIFILFSFLFISIWKQTLHKIKKTISYPFTSPGHPSTSFISRRNIKMQSFYFQNLLPKARRTFFSKNFSSKQTRSNPKACSMPNPIEIILLKIIIILLDVLSLRKTNSRIKCSVDLKNYRKNLSQDVIAMKSQIALTKQEEESSNIYCNLQFV